jgi:hypothetical protein
MRRSSKVAGSWEAVAKASLGAYGGHSSNVGNSVLGFISLLQSRGMEVPLAVPSKVGVDNVGLVATKPLKAGELVLSIPKALWQPHAASTALSSFKGIEQPMKELENKIMVR